MYKTTNSYKRFLIKMDGKTKADFPFDIEWEFLALLTDWLAFVYVVVQILNSLYALPLSKMTAYVQQTILNI